ncbi:MAG: excinuclease ABC subunit UvrC [Coxiellaceae bacterium]|jgi:excinuclease ABC subunit C|nr:excinuclease ABC subunit UvrC [Coxiellaceae bacterium]
MLDNPKQFLKSLPNKPGIYQMYDDNGKILYVGKAKNLKKRFANYLRQSLDPKTSVFMFQVKKVEIIITSGEKEALLLESNLIKINKPHYNILFKDDKSFPYIVLSDHDFPRLKICRGTFNKSNDKYFGPFPDTKAVRSVFNILQKIFRLRICQDNFMRNRSRPCLLYQIKLCGAPCVDCINRENYTLHSKLAEDFLLNRSNHVVQKLTKLMDEAANKLSYEQAANYRDQIINIRRVQSEQAITKEYGNYDVVAIVSQKSIISINVLFVRNGLVIGDRNYFPAIHKLVKSLGDILTNFLMDFYLKNLITVAVPDKVLLNIRLSNRLAIAKIFCDKLNKKIAISDYIRDAQKQLIIMAEANAYNAIKVYTTTIINYREVLFNFKIKFNLAILPKRIECFDVSHNVGEAVTASCVVFNEMGPDKKEYRSFNIENSSIGDDYRALNEVLSRRLNNLKSLPDIIVIDGGLGHLKVASRVLRRLQITNTMLLAIAKGKERRLGLDKIYLNGKSKPFVLSSTDPSFRLIQQIRDEAHRFAINNHRRKMRKRRRQSILDNISGIGKSKRIFLLKYFGGIEELYRASITDFLGVQGIGHTLARRIYEHLHE